MDTWQFILQKFVQEDSIILLYVLQSNGSSPGRQGFKMAVSSDGDIFGTIGGGIMEHKFVELSHALLKGNKIENEIENRFLDAARKYLAEKEAKKKNTRKRKK